MNNNNHKNKLDKYNNPEIAKYFNEFKKYNKKKQYFYSSEQERERRAQITIETIKNFYKKGWIYYDKTYQREYVWKNIRIKSDLIKSIILQLPVGFLAIRKTEFKKREIVDGQQRIKTILAFMEELNQDTKPKHFGLDETTSRFILKQKFNLFENEFDENYNNNNQTKINRFLDILKKCNQKKPFKLFWTDLPKIMQNDFISHKFDYINLNSYNSAQINGYFHAIQNQEKLQTSEILKSHPSCKKIYNLITREELKRFCTLINFSNKNYKIIKIIAHVILIDQENASWNIPNEYIYEKFIKIEHLNSKQIKLLKTIKKSISIYKHESIVEFYKDKKTPKFKGFLIKLLLLAELYSNSNLFLEKDIIIKQKILNKINCFQKIMNSKEFDRSNTEIPKEILDDITETHKLINSSYTKNQIITYFETSFNKLILYITKDYPEVSINNFLDFKNNSKIITNNIDKNVIVN